MSSFTHRFLVIIAISLSAFCFSGCEVFVDFGLKNSTFELYYAKIPGGDDENMMELMIFGYQTDNPDYRYIVNYFDDDRCTGRYYAADTLKYEVEGTWSLPESDVLRIRLDGFVDGDFKITKLDKITYLLKSDANAHGLPIQPPTTRLHLYNRKLH